MQEDISGFNCLTARATFFTYTPRFINQNNNFLLYMNCYREMKDLIG